MAVAGCRHLGNAGQLVAHVPEELVLGAHLAAVLAGVMAVGLDLADLQMFGVELQHLGVMVVYQDHGVTE